MYPRPWPLTKSLASKAAVANKDPITVSSSPWMASNMATAPVSFMTATAIDRTPYTQPRSLTATRSLIAIWSLLVTWPLTVLRPLMARLMCLHGARYWPLLLTLEQQDHGRLTRKDSRSSEEDVSSFRSCVGDLNTFSLGVARSSGVLRTFFLYF